MAAAETDTAAWTIARLLAWTRDYLGQRGVESPRLCAEVLLASALECERLKLYTRTDEIPPEPALTKFRAWIKQAAAGAPIAHLIGNKEFFSLSFEVTPDVLVPRPETETLVERAIHLARHGDRPVRTILDLCTGSGCVAIALAKNLPEAALFASDISEAALAVARRNAARHGLADRIDFRSGDLFAPWNMDLRFDVIVTNPPYLAQARAAELPRNVRDFEPGVALFGGDDGLAVLKRVLTDAPGHLADGGSLLTEIAFDQAADVTALVNSRDWLDTVVYRDLDQRDRVVHVRRRDGTGGARHEQEARAANA